MNQLHELPPPRQSVPELRRTTVCFRADSIEAKVDYTTWLNAWKSKMTFISRDRGCGCCIHMFDLEGASEALEALPETLLSLLKWKDEAHTRAPLLR